MGAQPKIIDHYNLCIVTLPDGGVITCKTKEDAELALDVVRCHYEGSTGRQLPRETLGALERAGHNALNSVLYRSALSSQQEQ